MLCAYRVVGGVAFTPRASLELDQLQLTLRDVPRSLIVNNRASGLRSPNSEAAALQIQWKEMTGRVAYLTLFRFHGIRIAMPDNLGL